MPSGNPFDTYKKEYEAEASKDAPVGPTGKSDRSSAFDTFKNENKLPGTTTERGTYVPSVGDIWDNYDQSQNAADNPVIQYGRANTARALQESTKTEEFLRAYGVEVPESDRAMGKDPWYKYPLAVLTQLQRGQFAVVGGLEGVINKDPSEAVRNFYRGLVYAEPHETADILERFDTFNDNPALKFTVGLAGDIALDPLTWLTFGTSGVARGAATKGLGAIRSGARFGGTKAQSYMKTAAEVEKYLSPEGKAILKEAIQSVGNEEMAVHAIIEEIAKGSKLGKKLIPHGLRIADWVPMIGGTRLMPQKQRLFPGSVLQYIDDVEASQSVMSKITERLMNHPSVDWFGKAFVPYWSLRKKFPEVIELEQAVRSAKFDDVRLAQEKLKKLLDLVPDVEERKLLTELLEKPWSVRGQQFLRIQREADDVLTVDVNTRYLEGVPTIDSGNVDYMMEMIVKGMHDGYAEAMLRPTASGGASLGEGAFGSVVGMDRLAQVLPTIVAGVVRAHPSKAMTFNIGDWVVKTPRLPDAVGNPFDYINSASNVQLRAANIANIKQMFKTYTNQYTAEDAALRILSGSPQVPEGVLVTRRLDEIFQNVHTGHTDTEFVAGMPIQFMVKKRVEGVTAQRWRSENLLRAQSAEQNLLASARFITSANNLATNVARHGVAWSDAHGRNFMVDTTGTVHWVDNGIWKDTISGKQWSANVPDSDALAAIQRDAQFSPDEMRTAVEKAYRANLENNPLHDVLNVLYQLHGQPTSANPWDLMLVQKLKDAGTIKSYSEHVAGSAFRADGGYRLSIGRYDADFFTANELFTAGRLSPITKQVRQVVHRTWTEVVPQVHVTHPRLLAMTPADQERMLKAFDMAKEWKTELEQTLLHWGLITPERIANFKLKFNLQHVPHFRNVDTPLGMWRVFQKALAGEIKIGNLKKRDIEGAINDINTEFGMDFFEPDLGRILFRHTIDVQRAARSMEMVSELAQRFGKPLNSHNAVINGRTRAVHTVDPGWMKVDHPAMDGLQIPEELASLMTRYSKTFVGDNVGRSLWKNYHSLLSLWKGYATYANPGFHGRNFFSNLFLLYLKDGPNAVNPMSHAHAAKIMSGKAGEITLHNGAKMTYDEVMTLAQEYGIYGTGWFHADIEGAFQQGLSKFSPSKLVNPFSQENAVFKAGRAVGGTVENEARMVGFINDLIRTGNPRYAASNTKKYLFDYDELTDFERNWMKGIFPFYTWMRKNAELEISQILAQPGKFANVAKVKSNIERAAPPHDKRWTPTYFKELYAVATPLTTSKGSVLYMNPNLPFQDLNKLFDPQDWMSSLAPWRAVIEVMTNTKFFNLRKIEKFEGELVPYDALTMVPPYIMEQIGPKIGAKKTFEAETNTWRWSVPAKVKYVLDQSNPFFKNVSEIAGFAKNETPFYSEERRPYDIMSRTMGIKLMPYNPVTELEHSIYERRDVMRSVLGRAKQEGKVPSQFLPESELPQSH